MKNKLLIIIFAIAIFLPISKTHAARLWSSGFELQSVADDVEFGAVFGVAAINTTTKHSGAASLYTSVEPIAGKAVFSASGYNTIFARAYIYIDTLPNALCTVLATYDGDGATYGARLRLNSNGTLELWDSNAQIGSDSDPLNTGQWYRLELKHTASGGFNNVMEGLIDGLSFASTSAGIGPIVGITGIRWGVISVISTGAWYFDDIAVNDTSGSYQNSWPGEGSIVHMQPDSAGDNNDCSSGDYGSVDEVTPNDATDYCVLDADGDILDVNPESSAGAGIGLKDTIILVQVGVRERAASIASEGWVLRIKSQASGTVLESGTVSHNDTTWKTNGDVFPTTYRLTSYVDPQVGGIAWRPSLLDSAQIGIRATDATPDIWTSALWALVEYMPVAPSTSPIIIKKSIEGPTIFKRNVIFK